MSDQKSNPEIFVQLAGYKLNENREMEHIHSFGPDAVPDGFFVNVRIYQWDEFEEALEPIIVEIMETTEYDDALEIAEAIANLNDCEIMEEC